MSHPRLRTLASLVTWAALLLTCTLAQAADAPKREEFAWRATLSLPAGASLARVTLPAEALGRLQTADGRDVRVFNADGEAVAFHLGALNASPAQLAPVLTPSYKSYPLQAAQQGKPLPKGAVQVRVATGNAPAVWVQLNDTTTTAGNNNALKSALFTTREEKQLITALVVQAELPANVPVQVTASASTDLAQWQPVALRGRLYRFDGDGAPANTTLELEQPLSLEGRYLRLDWEGYDGVRITSLAGQVAQDTPRLTRPSLPLANATAQGKTALEWSLDFATPIAALAISTTRANTLVPVRVLGRNDAATPWRQLGQGVVYRLGAEGSAQAVSPAILLNYSQVRWLRVEATNGMELPANGLQVSAEFHPAQAVFLASGSGPFELAVGRANTPVAGVPLAMLTATVGGKLDNVAPASIASVLPVNPAGTGVSSSGWMSRGTILWGVLLVGVLVLGAVAFSLLKQLKSTPGNQ